MLHRLLAAVVVVCLTATAQTTLTVDQLVSFIKSSVIELKHDDSKVAKFLHSVRLTERLDDRTIETLQGIGAGPKAVEALRALREQSQARPQAQVIPPAPPPKPIPPPSREEQGKIIAEVREIALNYTKNLPDFICTQVTRRFVDPRGGENWIATDTITARLSYFEQKEDYKLILVNNRPTDQSYYKLGGATSTGEFGSMLREIFETRSHARFDWDHWATMRTKVAMVFSYRVAQPYSQWSIEYERRERYVPGYHGLLYIDRDTHMVLRVTLEAEDIPPTFPVRMAVTKLDYDLSKVGDRDFMLPLRADIRMRADGATTKNAIEFRLYRKFSAESQIDYSTPAPLPEDKEQPLQSAPSKAPLPKK